jgi:branched-chain amino acid transport system permease protein
VIPDRIRAAWKPGLLVILALTLASVPMWAPRFWIYLATEALIFAIFAMSLDFLLGYAGLPSFGHAAFYGVGAYACALLAMRHVDGLLPLLLAGGVAAALISVPIGALSLRTSGIYFLMLTLAFAQMLWGLAVNWISLTRGTDGLIGIPRPTLVGLDALDISLYQRGPFFYLCFVVALLTFAVLQVLTRSPFGKTLEGIRDNERRMRALGYPSFRYRFAAFVIAGAIAGIAGSLAAMSNGYATPDLLYWTVSGFALVAVVVGGERSLVGPILGAFAVLFAQLGLSTYVARWELILGALFIAFVLFVPRGLIGIVRRA